MFRPWKEVALPHEDIRVGRLEEYTFMADLANVWADTGPVEYRDPGLFFRKTYPTEGLVKLLAEVLRRLVGKGGKPVIQLQTPFGGGKSHSLIALYHLFRSGNGYRDMDLVRKALAEAGVEEIPLLTPVVFVGTHADPLKGKTPWGEIGEQLGRYELVADHDRERVSPGREVLERLLGDGPVLILMDEIAEYIARCVSPKEVEAAGGNMEAARVYQTQVLTFFQELTEALSTKPNAALVATLPSSAPYGEEGERALGQLEKIFGRMEEVYEPVKGVEIYEVVRRRLFQGIRDPEAARATVEGYWEHYQRLGEDIPSWAKEPAYKEKMHHAYPLHPELIDLLFERWGTLATFQRTRGVLRFLALVVRDLYTSGHSAPLIQPSHVNLGNPDIKGELLKHIDSAYNSVVAADISDTNAKAQVLDDQMGEFAPYRPASGLATAIFLYSFSGGRRRGAPLTRLKLATWRPELPIALIGDVLQKLRDEARLWYLHEEEGLFYFFKTPNLNGVIVDKEMQITADQVTESLNEHIKKHAGNELKVILFPKASEDVPDVPEPRLVILAPEMAYEPPDKLKEFVQELMERAGTKYRVYKNALLALAPTADGIENLRRTVRRYLALHAIKDDRSLYRTLSEKDRERLEHEIRSVALDLPERLLSAYRLLFRPGREGPDDLGLATVGERASLAKRVRDFLAEEDLLSERIAPKNLLKAFRDDEAEKPLKEVYLAFFRYPGLAIPLGKWVLEDAVVKGVEEGAFGLRTARGEVVYKKPISRAALEDAVLIRPEALKLEGGEEEPTPISIPATEERERPGTIKEGTGERAGIWEETWSLEIPGERLHELVRGVLLPLKRAGAEVSIEVRIRAQADRKPHEEELSRVEETLKQLAESAGD